MSEATRCSTDERTLYEARIAELERRLREKDDTISVLTMAVKQANSQGAFEQPAGAPYGGTDLPAANTPASQRDQTSKK